MHVVPYLALFVLTSATVAGISNLFLGILGLQPFIVAN